MTREEIMQLNTDYLNDCESEHEMNELFYFVLELLKQEPKTDWIPVSERLPKKSGAYWCTFGGTYLTGSDYYTTESDAEEFFDDPEEYVGWRSQNVIAWMPLPKSYKPQESEDGE